MVAKTGGLESLIEKETVVFVSDHHCPYQDQKAVDLTVQFVKEKKPDIVIIGGDAIDNYSLSRYDKDASRASKLQEELDTTKKVLEQYRKASPNSTIYYLEGNHEERVQKWIKRNPDVHGLRVLALDYLLGLKDLGIKYVKEYEHKGFLFKHGDFTNQYHAFKELQVTGTSGMSGHNHRIMQASKTDRKGVHGWWCVGHLSDQSFADYVKSPNWQQGFGVVTFITDGKDKRFYAENVHITCINGVYGFLYGGKHYKLKD